MNSYILKKEHLPAYLKRLSKTFDVQVPVSAQGITLFAPYEEHLELDFASHTRLSAKSYFLPQHEVPASLRRRWLSTATGGAGYPKGAFRSKALRCTGS